MKCTYFTFSVLFKKIKYDETFKAIMLASLKKWPQYSSGNKYYATSKRRPLVGNSVSKFN